MDESTSAGTSATVIDTQVLRAYRETDYVVSSEPPVTLRIGNHNADLQRLHSRLGVTQSAFLTACNPFSRDVGAEENARRQVALEARLEAAGWRWLDGIGQHPEGGWAEASFLVLGISREQARALGTAFEQNAIVWTGPDAMPELVLLR